MSKEKRGKRRQKITRHKVDFSSQKIRMADGMYDANIYTMARRYKIILDSGSW